MKKTKQNKSSFMFPTQGLISFFFCFVFGLSGVRALALAAGINVVAIILGIGQVCNRCG
jgi:hypothetical protein